MIIYNKRGRAGFTVVLELCQCRFEGSVVLKVLPYSIVAALIALMLKLDEILDWDLVSSLHKDSEDPLFQNNYAMAMWASSVGFLLVFRGNLAYARFWEGRGAVAKFSSYLQDAALMAVSYDEVNKDMNQYREWKTVRCDPERSAKATPAPDRSCGLLLRTFST